MTSPRHLTRCPLSPGTPSHAGKQRKAGYTDQFLVKQGAPVGSTIVMTPTGYMTEEAWLEMAPTIAKGIREMPVIRDRPDWWVLKIIDGFGPHTSSEKAMEIYAAHKVLLLKEDGDTSHVCQMYDQRVARDDKKSMRQSLGYLRQSNKLVKGTIDGWQLVHVALAAARARQQLVSLLGRQSQPEAEHARLIPGVVQAHLALPAGRRVLLQARGRARHVRAPLALLARHDTRREEARHRCRHVARAWLQHRMRHGAHPQGARASGRAAESARRSRARHEGPLAPRARQARGRSTHAASRGEAQAKVASITTGLVSFQLHPKAADGSPLMSGIAHSNHLVKMARRSVPERTDLMPSAFLDVEYTSEQQRLINPRAGDYAMHVIATHAHGEGAMQSMSKRKLDNLGYIRGDCGIANDPDRVYRLKNQLGLTESLAAIAKETADAKASDASVAAAKLIESAPEAVGKLSEKGGDLNKMTMGEMSAIAFKHFKATVLKGNKAAHVKELSELIKQQPGALQLAMVPLEGAHSPAPLTLQPQGRASSPVSLGLILTASDEEAEDAVGDADEVMPAPKVLTEATEICCDWACENAAMTALEVEHGYCSSRRCKRKLHHRCFLAHAGEAAEGLNMSTRFCQAQTGPLRISEVECV